VGALGAALIEMTANLTIGRPRLAAVQDQAQRIERLAADLRVRLERLGDADTEAFDQVTAAYKLPRGDDAQKAARAQAIQSSLRAAADVPMETVRISSEVIDLAGEAAPLLNPAVISDVLVGALLAQAALESAALNVEINLASMTDAATIERYSTGLARAREGVAESIERILASGRSRFPGK
jgi:formiminotetrahydrofolate cyclodeaminase